MKTNEESIKKLEKKLTKLESVVSKLKERLSRYNMNYQSLYDEARSMAKTISDISDETHSCAMCKGEGPGSYSTNDYLKNVCEILFADEGYWKSEKYQC